MKNILIDGHEAEDIQKQVNKIIRGLGNPEPPLRLEEVRELLSLDRQFYSSTNDSAVREFVSRITVAGKQILKRPMLLFDAIRKADLSALWLPDKKRILIDESKPKIKHRWMEGHEVGHSIIPWHAELLFGDTEVELSYSCHQQMEAEANYASGQLLFLQNRFVVEARDLVPSIETVKHLHKVFGNTITSTLWRFVEEARRDSPDIGLVSQHPYYTGPGFNPLDPCRYFIQSPEFRSRFSRVTPTELFRVLRSYCGYRKFGDIGESEAVLTDDNGTRHIFAFESFSNTYEVLTLGVYSRPWRTAVAV